MKNADLSRAIGVTQTTISRWGKNRPRYATAYEELHEKHERVKRELATVRMAYEGVCDIVQRGKE